MRVDQFASELGVSTQRLLSACQELGFNAVDGASEIDVAALKRAAKENSARRKALATAAAIRAPKFCPQCGKPAAGTKFCVACGLRFGSVTTPPPANRATPARVAKLKHVCPYCQSDDDAAPFGSCPSCGTVLHGDCWSDNDGCPMPGCASAPK
jgi:ribosomal protein L37AE/L43A